MITNLIALIGLAAVPALLAVYLLRSRVKNRTVSSLMLWAERSQLTTGGGWIQKNRLPLLFFLELLIILLLVWAATNPLRLSRQTSRPLIIVLDNSASMSAVGSDDLTAANRALQKMPRLIKQGRFSPVRVMLAGNEPRWLSEESAQELINGKVSKDWNFQASAFQIDKALLLARENSTSSTKVLVISDARPKSAPTSGNLRWLALGQPLQNAGFVNAVRSGERCMVEIAGSGTTELELRMDGQIKKVSIRLPARKIYKMTNPSALFQATLPDDALAMDNQVLLLPKPVPNIGIRQDLQNGDMKNLINRSVASAGIASTGIPELWITDGSPTLTNLNTWVLHIVPADDSIPFTGPFVINHESPLMDGLSFEGLIWAGAEKTPMPGMPIVMAGNIPLLTRQNDLTGRPHFYLQMDPALSTIQHSPVWPALFWNLIQARAALKPGFKEVNLRPGMPLTFIGDVQVDQPEAPGLVEVESGGQVFLAAYNFMDAEESNLSDLGQGDDGSWLESDSLEQEYAQLAPPIILAAMGLLAIHQFLVLKESGVSG